MKDSLTKEKTIMVTQYKDKVTRLEANLKVATEENSRLVDRLLSAEKTIKLMSEERDKLKLRISRLV